MVPSPQGVFRQWAVWQVQTFIGIDPSGNRARWLLFIEIIIIFRGLLRNPTEMCVNYDYRNAACRGCGGAVVSDLDCRESKP